MHSSLWPTILRSDSTGSRNVHWSVATVSHFGLAFSILIFVTGIVTPLGLHDSFVPVSQDSPSFVYAADKSAFGNSTQARPNHPMSRECNILIEFCPGGLISADHDFNSSYFLKDRPWEFNATTDIPANLTAMFTSATKHSTVAGALDLQYRSWSNTSTPGFNNNQTYPKGARYHVDTLLSGQHHVLREGIVADMDLGGIGFRNHTIPSHAIQLGATWDEDILWLEPDISCANTNLSLHVTIGHSNGTTNVISRLALVDQGGWANLRHGNPGKAWVPPQVSNLDTRWQADWVAWVHNVMAAVYLNVTLPADAKYGLNVTQGKEYPMSSQYSGLGSINYPLSLQASALTGGWLGKLPDVYLNLTSGDFQIHGEVIENPGTTNSSLFGAGFLHSLNSYCSGNLSPNDLRYESFKSFECGAVFGVPKPVAVNGSFGLVQEIGSEWMVPMYVCAGAIKASVQTLTFAVNGSASLDDVQVVQRQDKKYSGSQDHPTWAIEYKGFSNLRKDAGFGEFNVVKPLWGIVDESYVGTPEYNFTKSPSFYVPHSYISRLGNNDPLDMLASSAAPVENLYTAISNFGASGGLEDPGFLPDYTGKQSLSLATKWRKLAETERGHDTILRLIWTDMMANSVLSAKPAAYITDVHSEDKIGGRRNARTNVHRVSYHIVYATPAFILLACCVMLAVATLISGVVNWRLLKNLRHMLNDTSLGRVATANFMWEGKSLSRASTGKWGKRAGSTKLRLGGEGTEVAMVLDEPAKMS